MEELRRCPLCGCEAYFEQDAYGTTDAHSCKLSFSIHCVKCGATAPNAYGYICINLSRDGKLNAWHDDRPCAVEAWNRRVNDV